MQEIATTETHKTPGRLPEERDGSGARSGPLKRLLDSGTRRKIGGVLSILLALAGPVCAVLTYMMMSENGPFAGQGQLLRIMLVIDFCVVLLLIAVIAWRIATLVLSRRARSAGSRLHLRLVRLFTLVSVAPAILLGVFAAVTVTVGLEGWFSGQVSGMVRNSERVARAYVREKRQSLGVESVKMANAISRAAPSAVPTQEQLQLAVSRVAADLPEPMDVFVLNSSSEIIARGPGSYLFNFEAPGSERLGRVMKGEVVIFGEPNGDEIRAIAPLPGLFDLYLYVGRPVDSEALRALDSASRSVASYEQMERSRGDLQLVLAGLYVGFASLILLAAIWAGIWLADRLTRPIGRLAGAAGRIAEGDLDVRVPEEKGDDEIATLSRAFNHMAGEVRSQRDALMDVNTQLDQRRNFMAAVLSGVSAGVVGLDSAGRVELANSSSERLLHLEPGALEGHKLSDAAPELAPILEQAAASQTGRAEGRARILRDGSEQELLVRVTGQKPDQDAKKGGFVVTFDDMTELVSAQRMAAWGDVARRVAHEIRNPLTPIQLSAERLSRKFGRHIEKDQDVFDHCTGAIIRQVEDIRRIVEEFSNFARMPEAKPAPDDLARIIREAATLRGAAHPGITFDLSGLPQKLPAIVDRGLMNQAFVNLFKNAAEAVTARLEADEQTERDPAPGEIRAVATETGADLLIDIIDNGPGLPKRERRTLTEPYVTTRKKGTGLGLAIVKRVIEQHGGRLMLEDAPQSDLAQSDPAQSDLAQTGARIRIALPLAAIRGESQVGDASQPAGTETSENTELQNHHNKGKRALT